ncbi:MAG: hypothetical protein P8P36_10515 [Akkermansiaceae bacterium]|nr:hypothetical protein [Akkermansiaceae bacterium]
MEAKLSGGVQAGHQAGDAVEAKLSGGTERSEMDREQSDRARRVHAAGRQASTQAGYMI